VGRTRNYLEAVEEDKYYLLEEDNYLVDNYYLEAVVVDNYYLEAEESYYSEEAEDNLY
jgi:hypothetical protein